MFEVRSKGRKVADTRSSPIDGVFRSIQEEQGQRGQVSGGKEAELFTSASMVASVLHHY